MKIQIQCILALLAAAGGLAAHAAELVDDAGHRLRLDNPPRRVVTLAPSLTEYVYAVGAGATLVGTVDTSNYPEAAQRVPRIGNYQRLDVERVVLLKPELVLVWLHGNQGRELEQLQAAGLRLFYLDPRRLDDVARVLERVGVVLGHERQAHAAAEQVRREIDGLRRTHRDAAPLSVFFQVWSEPLMTLNDEHLTSDLMRVCGGRNVFGTLPTLTPHVSVEAVVAADPQVMMIAEAQDHATSWWHVPQDPALRTWRRFPRLTAVQHGWMYALSGDLVTRQGPRSVEGARAMCAALDEVRAQQAAASTGRAAKSAQRP